MSLWRAVVVGTWRADDSPGSGPGSAFPGHPSSGQLAFTFCFLSPVLPIVHQSYVFFPPILLQVSFFLVPHEEPGTKPEQVELAPEN